MTAHSTDIALFHLVKANSIEGFTALYARHWEELYGYAFKILPDKDHVEDVLQELFLHIWDKRDTINIESSVKAYLFKSLKNRIYNFLKANAVKHAHYQVLLNSISSLAEEDTIIEKKEHTKRLLHHLEVLPDKMRRIAKLYLMEGLNIKEISDHLSLSEHTIRNQLNNVRRRLLRK
ncbi:RNA polymerase sigma-70 factor (ECF subfamily) [Chitinophaga niastensis]|uniref:RNA polymerase sigma-70 factor (ECF subfamily) n=1 Tax=Chitinophaga niastensis TaxID=536980 RepID=A0A2P8HJJ4_CHINA|nr:sigma-70 family RNA polymerase sigma factor [Chitinophaga niastensis]PSL46392.1 RNA polymerase sigma-70 factor (ECF subfamily) [Chitinophaga niastensis]